MGLSKTRIDRLKFDCIVATLWLAGTIALFHFGFITAGYIACTMLFAVVFLVSTTDFGIPSAIYNFLFGIKIE